MAIAKVWGGGLKNIKLETEVRNIVDNMLHTCNIVLFLISKKNFSKQFNIF